MNNTLAEAINLERLAEDPYPLYRQLLTDAPVVWSPRLKMWIVSRYADVVAILKDWERFGLESDHSLIADTLGPMMLSVDGRSHQRQRTPFATPFRPKPLRRSYAHIIADLTHKLIDDFVGKGLADLHQQFSNPLALLTVTTVLGFPLADRDEFISWYGDLAAAIGNVTHNSALRARGQAAFARFYAYVTGVMDELRQRPDDSILGQMMASEALDLSEDELVSNTAITFFGGLETTAALLSNALYCLLTHPEQLAAVRRDEKLLANGVEETLRWEAPVQTAHRHVREDVVLHGQQIRAGEMVQCMLGAANRDTAVFQNPDQFDVYRPNASKHLSFARGPHFCFGAPLARLEATIALPILLSRLPDLRLDNPAASRPFGHEFRAPRSLNLSWS